jgi:hypothetical protein
MSLYDFRSTQRNSSSDTRVAIREVNMTEKYILAEDSYRNSYIISMDALTPVVAIPQVGELWYIYRKGTDWYLGNRFESGNENVAAVELQPGDRRVDAGNNLHLTATNDINITGAGETTLGSGKFTLTGAESFNLTSPAITLTGITAITGNTTISGGTVALTGTTSVSLSAPTLYLNGQSWDAIIAQIQADIAAAVAGAIIKAPTTDTRNTIQSTGDFTSLTIKAAATQSKNLLEFYGTLNTRLGFISKDAIISSSRAFVSGGSSFTAGNNWTVAYLAGNVYYDPDAASWKNDSFGGNNGWAILGVRGDISGIDFISDTQTGSANRTYTPTQISNLRKLNISNAGTLGWYNGSGTIDTTLSRLQAGWIQVPNIAISGVASINTSGAAGYIAFTNQAGSQNKALFMRATDDTTYIDTFNQIILRDSASNTRLTISGSTLTVTGDLGISNNVSVNSTLTVGSQITLNGSFIVILKAAASVGIYLGNNANNSSKPILYRATDDNLYIDTFGQTFIRDSAGVTRIGINGSTVTITGTLSAGALTVTSLNAGSGTIQTTGTLSGGATTVTSLDAGSGTIQTTGTVSGGTVTATSTINVPNASIGLAKLSGYPSNGDLFAAGDGTWKQPSTVGSTFPASPTIGHSHFFWDGVISLIFTWDGTNWISNQWYHDASGLRTFNGEDTEWGGYHVFEYYTLKNLGFTLQVRNWGLGTHTSSNAAHLLNNYVRVQLGNANGDISATVDVANTQWAGSSGAVTFTVANWTNVSSASYHYARVSFRGVETVGIDATVYSATVGMRWIK